MIGFVDWTGRKASAASKDVKNEAKATDAILEFDGGERLLPADLLHVLLCLGTTGSGKTRSVLLPAVDRMLAMGWGGVVLDVKGSMGSAVRALAARHGREADVVEIGPYAGAMPVDLLAGADAEKVSELFRALLMSHAEADRHNMSFHVTGLKQAVEAWTVLMARCRAVRAPFSLADFERMLCDPEFARAIFKAFKSQQDLTEDEQDAVIRIESAAAHVVPSEHTKTDSHVWSEQVTYYMSVIQAGLRLFRSSPGMEESFFALGGERFDPEKWIYDAQKVVVLRFSPIAGPACAGVSRLLLREFYRAVYKRGMTMPEGQCTFLVADEFQDVICTDPMDALNDAAFIAKVREFRCATLLGTQSSVALSQRAQRGMSDVRTILGNCNARIFLFTDEKESCELAPEGERSPSELEPGQCILVRYDAASRRHMHSETGVNGMYERIRAAISGIVPGECRPAETSDSAKKQARERQKKLAAPAPDPVPAPDQQPSLRRRFERQDAGRLEDMPEENKTPVVCLEAVKDDGMALKYVPDRLRTEDLCLEAVRQNGRSLCFVPDRFKTPEICLAAAKQDGRALQYVPDSLRTEELCLEAVRQNFRVLTWVPAAVQGERICFAAGCGLGHVFDCIPDTVKTAAICLAAVQAEGNALEFVPAELKTQEICLAAIRAESNAVRFVPDKFKTEEFCIEVVSGRGTDLRYIPERLRTEAVCLAAVRQDGEALVWVPEAMKTSEICLEAVRNRIGPARNDAMAWVPASLRTEAFCLAAVKAHGRTLRLVPDALKTPEICAAAMMQDKGALAYVPRTFIAPVQNRKESEAPARSRMGSPVQTEESEVQRRRRLAESLIPARGRIEIPEDGQAVRNEGREEPRRASLNEKRDDRGGAERCAEELFNLVPDAKKPSDPVAAMPVGSRMESGKTLQSHDESAGGTPLKPGQDCSDDDNDDDDFDEFDFWDPDDED